MEYKIFIDKWLSEPVSVEQKIEGLIKDMLKAHNRDDLYREAIVGFSAADDERYDKLKEIVGPWVKNPNELLAEAKSVISYFVPFTKELANAPKNSSVVSELWAEAYVDFNAYFDIVSEAVAELLHELGFASVKIKAAKTYDPELLQSMWSHKSAAVIAGIAAFGANRTAITEKGCGGRYCSVITSAELKSDKPAIENKCLYYKNGSCGLCFKVCPAKAFTAQGFDKFACNAELKKNEQHLKQTAGINAGVCGKCLSVCPLVYIE